MEFEADDTDNTITQFHEMGLDDRILKAIARLGWQEPTLIQEKAIPLALEGKDILSRARTGSGKTAAYAIPVIQKILLSKQRDKEQSTKALVLVPSRELSKQAHTNILELSACCSRDVKSIDVSGQIDLAAQRPLLMENPDIVIGTPSRIMAHLHAKNLSLKKLETLVIDEADLIFSFGHEDDLRTLVSHLPKIYQAMLMSATLGDDVTSLKQLVLHNPVTLKLEESQLPEADRLRQYHIKCQEEDKFLLLFCLFKLRLVRGKSLIFVNDIDRSYKLKLFLEQFSLSSCVLNSELPVNSRCHLVTQFNTGLYDIIIASEETTSKKDEAKNKKNQKTSGKGKDKDYGVSRGIDFQNVSNVINFDFPPDADSYIHRVGRTARGGEQGTALSFVNKHEVPALEEVENYLTGDDGESLLKPYEFKMEEIEGFRYRAKDAMRAVTGVAVREARMKEIKMEVMNSKQLKSYFDDNPRDLQLLRHDKMLHPAKVHANLKNVPEYLVPNVLKGGQGSSGKKTKRQRPRMSHAAKLKKRKEEDPLKSFKFTRSKKN